MNTIILRKHSRHSKRCDFAHGKEKLGTCQSPTATSLSTSVGDGRRYSSMSFMDAGAKEEIQIYLDAEAVKSLRDRLTNILNQYEVNPPAPISGRA
jgi:hypothetical protein